MIVVSSMEGNNLHNSCESTGPLLVKQPMILALHERSCTLSHCQGPNGNRQINTIVHSSRNKTN